MIFSNECEIAGSFTCIWNIYWPRYKITYNGIQARSYHYAKKPWVSFHKESYVYVYVQDLRQV